VGGFTVDDAATLEQLAESGALAAALLPADAAVAHLARVDMSEAEAARLLHGQAVIGVDVQPAGPARAYGPDERFLGIVAFDSQRRVWRPQKMLAG
jgi:tRNA pseudouridine55 synthase